MRTIYIYRNSIIINVLLCTEIPTLKMKNYGWMIYCASDQSQQTQFSSFAPSFSKRIMLLNLHETQKSDMLFPPIYYLPLPSTATSNSCIFQAAHRIFPPASLIPPPSFLVLTNLLALPRQSDCLPSIRGTGRSHLISHTTKLISPSIMSHRMISLMHCG